MLFFSYLVDKPLPAADISEDNACDGEIVRRINICASLSQGHYHLIFQQARKGFIYLLILWLVFYIYNMLGEKEKQVVSARANDANKLIDWLIFLIETVIGPALDRLSFQNELSQRPTNQNSQKQRF